jgi:hypothetical protein
MRNVGWVAQLVEQRIENPRVGGSIPPPATSDLFFKLTGSSPLSGERQLLNAFKYTTSSQKC